MLKRLKQKFCKHNFIDIRGESGLEDGKNVYKRVLICPKCMKKKTKIVHLEPEFSPFMAFLKAASTELRDFEEEK